MARGARLWTPALGTYIGPLHAAALQQQDFSSTVAAPEFVAPSTPEMLSSGMRTTRWGGVGAVGTIAAIALLTGLGCKKASKGGLAEPLEKCKAATVMIRTERMIGSGFVAADRDHFQYLVTNRHVIADVGTGGEVQVTYHPGAPDEWTGPATVVAVNQPIDLAVLKTTGPREAPAPLEGIEDVAELVPVVAIGFPFGDMLALDGKRPTATMSRATISAVRKGTLGRVELLQLDNNLNPGNSGGPVVTQDGRVAGVSVAALRGAGIGFVIPWARVQDLLDGRGAVTHVNRPAKCTDGCSAQVEVTAVDPFHQVRKIELRKILADDAFLSARRSGAPIAEGAIEAAAERPASGALHLTTTISLAPSQRVFLQLGYQTDTGIAYELPFEAGGDDGSEPTPAEPVAPPRRPEPPPTRDQSPCDALAGTWQRTDGFVFVFAVDGCAVTGRGDVPSFRHTLHGNFMPSARKLSFTILRENAASGCRTEMYGDAILTAPRSLTLDIEGTDGRCELPKAFTDHTSYSLR